MSNRCRVFGPCIFYALRKIKAKCPEVILVLASNQRKPYEVLIIQGKPPSPNLEKVVISVGKGNSYGHPTDNNLSRLRDADVTVYRTDLNGDIFVTSDGQSVSISSDKSVSKDEIMTPGGSVTTSPPATQKPDPVQNDSPSAGTDYIVNTNTGKFHYPSCSSVKKMKESNKMFFTGTRDELISQGYDPCGNCHP